MKHNQKGNVSLINPQSTGGDIAESGFQYQANLIAARIPKWLYHNGFTAAVRESLGDVEASFFFPGQGSKREFVEYKNHRLTQSEFWPEIKRFQEMDEGSQGAYYKFVLACTDVSDEIKPIINSLRRVREPFSFYQGAPSIQEQSYADYEANVTKLGISWETAIFLYTKVWFEIDLTDAENFSRELFRDSLFTHFPEFQVLQGMISTQAYINVVELLRNKKNIPVTRREFEKAIWDNTGSESHLNQQVLLHTSHDEISQKPENAICFDWKDFFGGSERQFPSQDKWNNILVHQLEETKKWLFNSGRSRRILLSGNRRLSASIAIGTVFSSVSGFIIEMETKNGLWKTDNYPLPDTPDYSWTKSAIDGKLTGELAFGIGVMKKIDVDVEHYLELFGFEGQRFYLRSDDGLSSDRQLNLAVDKIKKILLEKISTLKLTKIHLFIAGPAQLALFLGHRLNATCLIQCYERQADGSYIPTCLLIN